MVAVLGVVATIVAVSRQREAVARREAEAAELLALGRLELDDHPTAALAHAVASLERVPASSKEGLGDIAMRNATDAALELIDSLTLTYNKVRQDAITKEMLDIAGGAEALAQSQS